MSVGVILLVFAGSLIGLLVGAGLFVQLIVNRTVVVRHRLIEFLYAERRVPDSWADSYNAAVAAARARPDAPARVAPAVRREGGKIVRRLDRLLRYVDTTRLMEDEETRQQIATGIEAVCNDWLRKMEDATQGGEYAEKGRDQ